MLGSFKSSMCVCKCLLKKGKHSSSQLPAPNAEKCAVYSANECDTEREMETESNREEEEEEEREGKRERERELGWC